MAVITLPPPRRPRHPKRVAPPDPLQALCGDDQQARQRVLRHLPTLRQFRDVRTFVAFCWPDEVRQGQRVSARRLQARYHALDALLRTEDVGRAGPEREEG